MQILSQFEQKKVLIWRGGGKIGVPKTIPYLTHVKMGSRYEISGNELFFKNLSHSLSWGGLYMFASIDCWMVCCKSPGWVSNYCGLLD